MCVWAVYLCLAGEERVAASVSDATGRGLLVERRENLCLTKFPNPVYIRHAKSLDCMHSRSAKCNVQPCVKRSVKSDPKVTGPAEPTNM